MSNFDRTSPTPPHGTQRPPMKAHEQAIALARALDEKLAQDIRVYDVSKRSNLTDYEIVATGISTPHLKALVVDLQKRLKARGIVGAPSCGAPESGWVVLDVFDVIVHIFTREMRDYYQIEELWDGAPLVPFEES